MKKLRASIVILARVHPENILGCLLAVAQNSGPKDVYETIVVLNEPEPVVAFAVADAQTEARLFSVPKNLGFSGGCNYGARQARGEYLVFLNDDAFVEPGWLDALIASADAHPRAGAVGSKILFVDGRVQEAGAVIWNDGSTAPVGRGLPAGSRAYNDVREVDYSSANGLLVRRDLFDKIGGFDEAFAPAYYEDVDLCLSLHARGFTVLYEPRSRIRHIEAASVDSPTRAMLFKRNQRTLRNKWQAELADYTDPRAPYALTTAIERAQPYRRRVLVVDDRLPSESVGSGFGLMQELLFDLHGRGYAVTFCPTKTYEGDIDALAGLGVALFDELLEEYVRRPDVQFDAVVVARPHNYERYGRWLRVAQPQARIVYNVEALFHRRLQTEAALTTDRDQSARYALEAKATADAERAIVEDADYVVCIADEEAEICRSWRGHGVELLRPLRRNATATDSPFEDRWDVVFVAGWLAGPRSPNISALQWFAAEIFPRVLEAVPWVRLKVVGARPPAEIRDLGPGIALLGFVPDVTAVYERSLVAVAPIRTGAGVKIKTIEAMQFGVPVVATRIGAEGLGEGIEAAVDVTDDPTRFAEHVIRLVTDEVAWKQRRRSIADYVRRLRNMPRRGWDEIIDGVLADERPWLRREPTKYRSGRL
jgi:O-antigen biosynthesis protein